MQGTVKTYLPEKKYGFIKGDDGKDYFFHESEFRNRSHISFVCEEARIEFEQQATPKGYKAKNCSLVNSSQTVNYVVPDEFIVSKSNSVNGWEVMEEGQWTVCGSGRTPDEARKEMIERARYIGGNALVNCEYFKTTDSEGNYQYTVHNFRAVAVILAKKNSRGTHTKNKLLGLNDRATSIKKDFMTKNRIKESEKVDTSKLRGVLKVLFVVLFLQFFIGGLFTLPIIFIIIGIFVFLLVEGLKGISNEGWWLKKIEKSSQNNL